MPELQRLRADHAAAVLAFERANRAWFAASISDRGDEYFAHFAARHQALLADQEAGHGAYHVLVAEDGAVLGRFNLVFVEDGVAELGYRVAQGSRAVASRRRPCATCARWPRRRTASAPSGPPRPTATSPPGGSCSRPASSRSDLPIRRPIGGKQGTWYERDLRRHGRWVRSASPGRALPAGDDLRRIHRRRRGRSGSVICSAKPGGIQP